MIVKISRSSIGAAVKRIAETESESRTKSVLHGCNLADS